MPLLTKTNPDVAEYIRHCFVIAAITAWFIPGLGKADLFRIGRHSERVTDKQ